MFAIEIDFNDGVSQSETILVRRPQVVIGSSEAANVVIEDMKDQHVELRVVRQKGRRLRVNPLGMDKVIEELGLQERLYESCAQITLGSLQLYVQALDADLLYRDGEAPDRSGVRIMRTAASQKAPEFPAVLVPGAEPMTISFSPQQSITIGRSNQCLVRIDSPEISNQHARLGYERGEFWVEDLGSSNGTFLNRQQIGGKAKIPPGAAITLARGVTVVCIDSEEAAQGITAPETGEAATAPKKTFPAITCLSEGARPSRIAIGPESTIKIGRDPSNDMWLGVPHVSRMHCTIYRGLDDELIVKDHRTFGIA